MDLNAIATRAYVKAYGRKPIANDGRFETTLNRAELLQENPEISWPNKTIFKALKEEFAVELLVEKRVQERTGGKPTIFKKPKE